MSEYRNYIIQPYENIGEPSNKRIRARPLPGQGVSTTRKVACSEGMREAHPIGTCFMVECTVTDREGTTYLYRHYNWHYEVISREDADIFIRNSFGGEILT